MNALLQTLKFLTFDFQINILDMIRFSVPAPFKQGMYEVLNFEYSLELLDIEGREAVIRKREVVRFLQDNIIAYQDQAWGDGDIFAEYKCSPGIPVDSYLEGNRYRVLISLRETKNCGDVEEFHIERHIHGGFAKAQSYFQNKIDHCTRRISIGVVFPKERPPRQAVLIEHNANRTTSIDTSHTQTLPD